MKKYQEEHAAHLGKRTKKIFVTIIAIILSLSLSAVALADNGKSGGQGPTKTPTVDNRGEKSNDNGKSSEQGKGNTNTERNAEMSGINTDKIEEAIAALTDTTTQESLTALLTAYETAWAAKQTAVSSNSTEDLDTLTAAITSAKAALDTALVAAGIDTDTLYGTPDESKNAKGFVNGNRPALSTDTIEAAIATLDDSDANKATLTTLLADYEAALAALNAADTTTLSADELQALADAVQSAETALLEASRSAGLIGGLGRGQFVEGYAFGKDKLSTDDIADLIAAMDDTDANKATLTELLNAYKTALAAEEAADTSTLTEEEIAALEQATDTAAEALRVALEAAGITADQLPSGTPQPLNQQQEGEEYQTRVISENGDSGSEPSGDLFASFLDWLGSLFD